MTRLRRSVRDEAGFTLVELLVVLLLVTVVGSIVSSITITATKTAARQNDQVATLNAAKTAMERITREIRGANSLVTTAPREVSFVTRTSGVRRATRIFARTAGSSTELVQSDVTTHLTTGAAISSTERVVLGGLAVGRSEALFRYYAGEYHGEGHPSTVELVSATPGSARTVGVRVRLNRAYGAPPLDLYQVVSVRNLED